MLKELLNDHQLYHSEFQQDYLITTKAGGTEYGQYKQALRELYKRFRGLRESYCDREKLQVEIDEQSYRKNTEAGLFPRRYAAIEFKRKTMQMEECERVIKDTEREFKRFYQQACFLKERIGELTDEKRNRLDKEMNIFKVKEMAAIDYVTSGHLSATTFEYLAAFPKTDRKKLLEEVSDRNKLIQWYEDVDKDFLELTYDDIDIKQCMLEM